VDTTRAEKNTAAARAYGRTIRTGADLVERGVVDAQRGQDIDRVVEDFSMSITEEVIETIDSTDSLDPIARQYIPSIQELNILAEERGDPIGDDVYQKVKGVIHRYPDRLLLKAVNVCPVYCRFCFRREKVGPGHEALSPSELAAAFAYIRNHSEIWEVILTGGDPFMLSISRLKEIIAELSSIGHVGIIRVHTRVPVAAPHRITKELATVLRSGTTVYVVVHCNHARELTGTARNALALLVDNGIPLLSQTVLLRGVNDDSETLATLFRTLIQSRVKPYYLHHGDLAKGTSHFRTTITEGQALMKAIRGRVSGICQPTYVLDIPGGFGKVPIGPNYLRPDDGDVTWEVEDINGLVHAYPPRPTQDRALSSRSTRQDNDIVCS
jgi:lysine 2,3-aminomutase